MARHVWLIRRKWLRLYWHGSYSWLEINIGRGWRRHELIVHIRTTDCWVLLKLLRPEGRGSVFKWAI